MRLFIAYLVIVCMFERCLIDHLLFQKLAGKPWLGGAGHRPTYDWPVSDKTQIYMMVQQALSLLQ